MIRHQRRIAAPPGMINLEAFASETFIQNTMIDDTVNLPPRLDEWVRKDLIKMTVVNPG